MASKDTNAAWLAEMVHLQDRVNKLEALAFSFGDLKKGVMSMVSGKKFDKDGILHEMLEKHKVGPTSTTGDHMEFDVNGHKLVIDRVDDKTFSMKVDGNSPINFTGLADMEKHLASVKAMKAAATTNELLRYSRAIMRSRGPA